MSITRGARFSLLGFKILVSNYLCWKNNFSLNACYTVIMSETFSGGFFLSNQKFPFVRTISIVHKQFYSTHLPTYSPKQTLCPTLYSQCILGDSDRISSHLLWDLLHEETVNKTSPPMSHIYIFPNHELFIWTIEHLLLS